MAVSSSHLDGGSTTRDVTSRVRHSCIYALLALRVLLGTLKWATISGFQLYKTAYVCSGDLG